MSKEIARNPNYRIDQLGNVYSVRKMRQITPKVNHDGYLRIQLWDHGKCEFVSIHRLVAEAYIPNPDNKPFVNHIDGDKQNNYFRNLEWCTQKENIAHAWRTGLSHSHLNKAGKVVSQYSKEGQFIRTFPSTMEVQRELGIAHSNIVSSIKRGGTAGGYIWKWGGVL